MTSPIEAYPLCWPDGWPRKQRYQRRSSQYHVEFATARDHLVNELRLSHARDVVISTNVPLRRDGLPLANMPQPADPGVAVYWTATRAGKHESRNIACDAWHTVRENLRAVGLTVEAIRSLERTGASEILDRAYAGFARLPAGAADDHWSTLGLPKGWRTVEQITQRYRELAREHHPDRGGDPVRMASINAAYHQALSEAGA
jgi:hypothetical protein